MNALLKNYTRCKLRIENVIRCQTAYQRYQPYSQMFYSSGNKEDLLQMTDVEEKHHAHTHLVPVIGQSHVEISLSHLWLDLNCMAPTDTYPLLFSSLERHSLVGIRRVNNDEQNRCCILIFTDATLKHGQEHYSL